MRHSLTGEDTYIILAKLGRPHGTKGWLNVHFAGEHLRHFVGQEVPVCELAAQRLWVAAPKIRCQKLLVAVEPPEGTVKRVLFSGVNDRNAATQLTHLAICQKRGLLCELAKQERKKAEVPLAELWYFELLGLTVCDSKSQQPLGQIVGIEEFGSNTLLAVSATEKNHLLRRSILVPFNYPHWGEADTLRGQIALAEWQHLAEI